jgi:hypothetical protein
MHRYVERCLPTLERFRVLVRAKAKVDKAQREVTRVWGRVSKTVVKWAEELKQTMEEANQGEGEIQYPKSQKESLREFTGKFVQVQSAMDRDQVLLFPQPDMKDV